MPVTVAGGNHVLLDGETGPYSGSAAPRNTSSANARRFTACDTGAPELHARGHGRPSYASRRACRLNQNASASNAEARVDQPQLPGRRLALERGVVVGPDLALREVGLARLQAQQLGVLVGRDLERQPIEMRQLRARRVLAPVVRVARERPAARRPGTPARRTARGPTSSAGGVVGPHCFRSVPALSAASSLCFGRMGSASSSRRPGPNADGNVTTTVRGVGRGDRERLAADEQRVGERAAGLLVVDRLEREQRRRRR